MRKASGEEGWVPRSGVSGYTGPRPLRGPFAAPSQRSGLGFVFVASHAHARAGHQPAAQHAVLPVARAEGGAGAPRRPRLTPHIFIHTTACKRSIGMRTLLTV